MESRNKVNSDHFILVIQKFLSSYVPLKLLKRDFKFCSKFTFIVLLLLLALQKIPQKIKKR